jgi:hypothetical protein
MRGVNDVRQTEMHVDELRATFPALLSPISHTLYPFFVMSHEHNAGQNRNINITTKSFENVEKFKYLRTTLTKQN